MSVDSVWSTFLELSLPGFNKKTFEHAFIHISVMNFDSYCILLHTRTLLPNMKEMFRQYAVALLAIRTWNSEFDRKNYAYYVEVPRILIYGSNFPFIWPVEFLKIFHFCFVFAHSAHLWQFVLTYTHTIRCLLNVFEDILYYIHLILACFSHTLSLYTP